MFNQVQLDLIKLDTTDNIIRTTVLLRKLLKCKKIIYQENHKAGRRTVFLEERKKKENEGILEKEQGSIYTSTG